MPRVLDRSILVGCAVLIVAGVGLAAAREKAEQRDQARAHAARITGGNPDAGLKAISSYGCGSCHQIPGAPGASGTVGPPLQGIGGRTYLAGKFSNTAPNMIQWIRFPQHLDPGVVMPEMGVTEQSARDIAAYLYSLS